MKLYPILSLLAGLCWTQPADHLIFTQIVTLPDEAEAFTIHNPTGEEVNLANYFICDDKDYYKMQTEPDNPSPSHPINGFTAQFPDLNIYSGDTLFVVLNEDFQNFYGTEFSPDLSMFGDGDNSLIPTTENSFGIQPDKLNDDSECLILFYWDGDESSLIEDVDYFVWGANVLNVAVDKSGIGNYENDTPADEQLYFEDTLSVNLGYFRIGLEENGEAQSGGNGISGHDETSENFRGSWQVMELFQEEQITIFDIQENFAIYDGQVVTLKGVVTIGDDLLYPGKTKFYIQDNSGRGIQVYNSSELPETFVRGDYLEVTGEIEKYEGDVEITNPSITLLGTGYELPETYIVIGNESESMNGTWAKVNGILTDYWFFEPSDPTFTKLTISNDYTDVDAMFWDSAVSADLLEQYENYENDDLFAFEIYGVITFYEGNPQLTCGYLQDLTITEHEIVTSEELVFEVAPYPFIPSRGEEISYSYSVPNGFRCVLRVFDISGRFITTLYEGVPVFYDDPVKIETWNGRNHLGELIMPGVYLLHMEATEVHSGKSYNEIGPMVIGVPVR